VTLPLRAEVRKIAAAMRSGASDPDAAFEEARKAGDADRAFALLAARAEAGLPPNIEDIAAVLPDVTDFSPFVPLVAHAVGDRARVLLDLVDRGCMSSEREALCLWIAARLHAGSETARIAGHLRTLARYEPEEQTATLVAAAARALGDESALAVVRESLSYIPASDVVAMEKSMRVQLEEGAPLDGLPEEKEDRIVGGYTLKRAAPKVGRNDPCPCGSGRKYKKCHGAKGENAGAGPAHMLVAGMTPEQVDGLPIQELLDLEVGSLEAPAHVAAFRKMLAYRRWDAAARSLEQLATREGFADQRDGYRVELIDAALQARAVGVAKAQVALLSDADKLPLGCRAALELLEPVAESAARIDALTDEALRAPDALDLVEIALSLLDHVPALGIVFARGAIAQAHAQDAETLLEYIEEARDRLALPPGDEAATILDALLDLEVESRVEEAEQRARGREEQRLVGEARALRAEAMRASSRIAELEAQLRAQQQALARADDTRTLSAGDDEERRRLRAKVGELKTLLKEGNEERTRLRRELTARSESLAAEPSQPGLPAASREKEEEEEEGRDVEVPGRGLLILRFARAVEQALREVPVRIARDAITLAAALAAGDEPSWREVKQLEDFAVPLYRARVGIHYRILFRMGDGVLEVVELLHRKDLDTVVKRYRARGSSR
jgi:hypothetical protein